AVTAVETLTTGEVTNNGTVDLPTLRANSHNLVTGKRPHAVVFPDGSTIPSEYWSEVARTVVQWLAGNGKVPQLPFQGGRKGKCYFLNSSPCHVEGDMRKPIEVQTNGSRLFIDVAR